jgi:pyridoxamine 5'-phosphate oxidase
MTSIADIRKDYKLQSLGEADVAADPFTQFTAWWQEAVSSQIEEVNAMTLATVTAEGRPDARIVLLKGFDENGFVFYSNYTSRKGRELAAIPYATLVFFWKELERQIRVEGSIELVSSQQSEAYYHSRPELSRLGAWASPQSEIIPNRQILEENMEKYRQQFAGNIPRPLHWGGYVVKPEQIEFWQGRRSRLHDRLKYIKSETGSNWQIVRLAP